MRNKRLISIIALVAVVFALTVGSVSAFQPRADLASVWTTSDLSGHVNANSFTIGQTAYIWWTPTRNGVVNTGSVDIQILKRSDRSFVADLGTFDPSGQPVSWTPSVEGYYYVTCAGLEATDFPIAVNTVHFVLPESVFGALAAIGAGIAAFATVKIYQGRTKR